MGSNEPSEVQAYSPATDTHYVNWDALVEAEANGYVAVAVLQHNKTGIFFTVVVGPEKEKRKATNLATKIRARHKKQLAEGQLDSTLLVVNVRPAWKEF